jgi:midasin
MSEIVKETSRCSSRKLAASVEELCACSVLEPGRMLTLAEKGGAGAEEIVAAPGFRLVATMNPGGDYGKRELSPALANRFTTIWVPPIQDEAELAALLDARLAGLPALYHPCKHHCHGHISLSVQSCLKLMPEALLADEELRSEVAGRLLQFWRFFREQGGYAAASALSVRDLLAWASFIITAAPKIGALAAYAHGAHLVLLDGIGLGIGLPSEVCCTVLWPLMPRGMAANRCLAILASTAACLRCPWHGCRWPRDCTHCARNFFWASCLQRRVLLHLRQRERS